MCTKALISEIGSMYVLLAQFPIAHAPNQVVVYGLPSMYVERADTNEKRGVIKRKQ